MYYLKFMVLSFIFFMALITLLLSNQSSLSGGSIITITLFFWISQFIYIKWILYHKSAESMSCNTLIEIEREWTIPKYFNRTPELSRLYRKNNNKKLLQGLKRIVDIQSELLQRTQSKNINWSESSQEELKQKIIKNKESINSLLGKEKTYKSLNTESNQLPIDIVKNHLKMADEIEANTENSSKELEIIKKKVTNNSTRKKSTKTLLLESFANFLVTSNTSNSAQKIYLDALKHPEIVATLDKITKSKIQNKIIEYMEQAKPDDLDMFYKTIKNYLKKAEME